MPLRTLLISTILLLAAARADGADPPVHFWLSTNPTASNGPEAPGIEMLVNKRTTLYLWARPSRNASLKNFSLNIVSSVPGIDLADGTFFLHNDASSSTSRFEFVNDSNAVPPLVSERTEAQSFANADSLLNLQGFTVFSQSTVGVGPTCEPGANHCRVGSDGRPVFLLGSFMVKSLTIGTQAQLFLQVGDVGMNQEVFAPGDFDSSGLVDAADYLVWKRNFGSTLNLVADGNGDGVVNAADYTVWRDHLGATSVFENSAATTAMFGLDATPVTNQPIYNTATHRGVTLAGDDPDAVINVIAAAAGQGGVAAPEPAIGTLVGWVLLLAARRNRPRR
jgi:hypothetical protein